MIMTSEAGGGRRAWGSLKRALSKVILGLSLGVTALLAVPAILSVCLITAIWHGADKLMTGLEREG